MVPVSRFLRNEGSAFFEKGRSDYASVCPCFFDCVQSADPHYSDRDHETEDRTGIARYLVFLPPEERKMNEKIKSAEEESA